VLDIHEEVQCDITGEAIGAWLDGCLGIEAEAEEIASLIVKKRSAFLLSAGYS
jgi:hypothetical protein